ncbi:MAG: ribbon-helix-helix protein, CopG family [Deltaproteobacteria bacterium]|nr:ribbon-helix-helix protein, CopG family [Deltaproteobacteria bacterium]
MATKTLSIRMDDDDYKFLSVLAKEEKEDVSKAVRELVEANLEYEDYLKGLKTIRKIW